MINTKREKVRKFKTLQCEITAIEEGRFGRFALIHPLDNHEVLIEGSITCAIKEISGKGSVEIGTIVLASNVHWVNKGWRAKKATVVE